MKLASEKKQKIAFLAGIVKRAFEKLSSNHPQRSVLLRKRKNVGLVRPVPGNLGRKCSGAFWLRCCRAAGRFSFSSLATSGRFAAFTDNKALKAFASLTRTQLKPAPLS